MAHGAGYTITTRSPGEVVTATKYNADHQNHIDNGWPGKFDDYSDNNAEMQSTTDPYPGSSESLATTLAGELERLRYCIAEIKQAMNGGVALTHWYYDVPAGLVTAVGGRVNITTGDDPAVAHAAMTRPFTAADVNWTVLTWDTVEWENPSTVWDVGQATRVVAPKTGKYRVSATVEWLVGGAAAGSRVLAIRKNGSGGSLEALSSIPAIVSAPAGTITQQVTGQLQLTAADYIEVVVQQDSNAPVEIDRSDYSPIVEMELIGG